VNEACELRRLLGVEHIPPKWIKVRRSEYAQEIGFARIFIDRMKSSDRKARESGMRKSGNRFFARIPL
jgi:hypothetical protein